MTVFKYGDDVNTDVIIPARYLNASDEQTIAAHCMEDIDPAFAGTVRPGDIVVVGENFGCGSSREHAPLALRACGVRCVIAASFARIFYRNAINIGLPILECPAAARGIDPGDAVEIDFAAGIIKNETKRENYAAERFPPFIQSIMDAGGLLSALREVAR